MISMLLLLTLWTVQTLLCGTATAAVQSVPRARLDAALRRRGRQVDLDLYDQRHHEYALTALIYRQAGIVLFVLTVAAVLPASTPSYLHWMKVFGISAGWFLVFGVSVPSAWARYAGDQFLARSLPFIELAHTLTAPVLLLLRGVDEVVRRLAGVPREEAEQTARLERGILDAVSDADVEGPVDESEKEMIRSVMSMDRTSVAQVMTPRTDLVGVEATASLERIREVAVQAGHTRIPVFEETLDHIVGILHVKDLIGVTDAAEFSIRRLMRGVYFVPETKDLASLLREFQAKRVHMAIVLDEYGGTAGLVTIEDILEEVVGEIADEHDDPVAPMVRRIDARTAEVDARMRVEEINEEFGASLPEEEAYDTVAGFVFSRLGRIPRTGESLTADGLKIEIVQATDRSIVRVRLRQLEGAAGGASA